MKPKVKWFVVVDSGKMKVFEKSSMTQSLHKIDKYCYSTSIPPSHELTSTDRGKERAPVTGIRHAFERKTDPRDKVKNSFLHKAAECIEEIIKNELCDQLYLFASAPSLGIIREQLPSKIEKHIIQEIPKDLTNLDENSLRDYLDHNTDIYA